MPPLRCLKWDFKYKYPTLSEIKAVSWLGDTQKSYRRAGTSRNYSCQGFSWASHLGSHSFYLIPHGSIFKLPAPHVASGSSLRASSRCHVFQFLRGCTSPCLFSPSGQTSGKVSEAEVALLTHNPPSGSLVLSTSPP